MDTIQYNTIPTAWIQYNTIQYNTIPTEDIITPKELIVDYSRQNNTKRINWRQNNNKRIQ
jgi:hypothetical protein